MYLPIEIEKRREGKAGRERKRGKIGGKIVK